MMLTLDFGGSTIDSVYFDTAAGHKSTKKTLLPKVLRMVSFERTKVSVDGTLASFLKSARMSLKNVEKIRVTGGKSRFFEREVKGIPVEKVSEIDAIGRGGYFLLHFDPSLRSHRNDHKVLVVSMGTGTCMVTLQQSRGGYEQSIHSGGTGVGGGTFLGLSRVLLGETNIAKLVRMFSTGDHTKVDVAVGDIVGSGIGLVPAQAVASNLAKLSREIRFAKADVASGIVTLIGQTIGLIAVFCAKANNCSSVLLTGKLTRVQAICQQIFEVGKIYNIRFLLSQHAAYVSALGAALH